MFLHCGDHLLPIIMLVIDAIYLGARADVIDEPLGNVWRGADLGMDGAVGPAKIVQSEVLKVLTENGA